MYLHLRHQSEIAVHKQIKSPEGIFWLEFAVKKYYSIFVVIFLAIT